MKFRPCIDIHKGEVKQIVGSTLTENTDNAPVENFVADRPASEFARLGLAVCVSIFQYICFSPSLSIFLSVFLSISLSIYLSICMIISQSIFLSIYLSM
jgi:hypothetical protein